MANIDGWFREAIQFNSEGSAAQALERCRKILKKVPKHPGALALAGVLSMDRGDAKEAIQYLQKAVKIHPGDGSVHLVLARAFRSTGDHAGARKALEQATGRGQSGARLFFEQGLLAMEEGQVSDSIRLLGKAVTLTPTSPEFAFELGVAKGIALDFPGCVQAFERAAALRPGHALSEDQALFFTLYDETLSLAEVRARHDKWGSEQMARLQNLSPIVHTNRPDPERPLRVGLISGDFRQHAVTYFLQPLLTHPNPDVFELTCYANVEKPDAVTEVQRSLVPRWRDIVYDTDAQVAQRIREDGIDILIDLSGHSTGNRLRVMALRPAPVQATWLGHPSTTGLPTVDYRLTDRELDPPGTERFYRERHAYIEGGFCAYEPPPDSVAPEVGPLPAVANGHVTFGSVMNPRKINERVIGLWSRVLTQVPGSQLKLLRSTFRRGEMREKFLEAFEAHGVDRSRVEITGDDNSGWDDVLGFYNTVDLSMDTFRYNGHTTTCEALWMGVPVVALSGEAYIGRVGQALYAMLDLPEMVAESEDAFVSLAVGLANDTSRLSALRAGMRDRMRASRLLDAEGFTAAFADSLRRMWREWCAEKASRPG
ncbi:MAG: tetratricopeptide repeat protein [Nitrospirota bacterium]|nr:tetratricopeptide repeat protein [Nitrospirota bacterium]